MVRTTNDAGVLARSGRMTSIWQNRKAFFVCSFVAMASFQYGVDNAIVGGFLAMPGFLQVFGYPDSSSSVGYNINTTVQQLISSLMILGAFIGAAATGPFSKRWGRKTALYVASVGMIVAVLIQALTTSLGGYYFARILLGFCNGFYVNYSVTYLSEAAPGHLRGIFTVFYQWWVNIGSLWGAAIDDICFYKDGRIAYQIPLCTMLFVPLVLLFSLTFIVPESPRWLVSHNRIEEARKSLRTLRGKEFPQEYIEEEISEISQAVEAEAHLLSQASLIQMFRGTDLRRTLISIGSICCEAASGVGFMIVYGAYFFTEASTITNPIAISMLMICLGIIGTTSSLFLNRYFGRRPIMMIGSILSGLCLLFVAVAYTVTGTKGGAASQALVALTTLFLLFYNATVGPLCWVLAGEIPAQHLRSYTLGLASGVGFLFFWLISFTTPYFLNPEHLYWGAKIDYIYGPTCMLIAPFVFFFVPETKDRTLEELDEMFHQKVSVFKWKSYVCTGEAVAHTTRPEEKITAQVETVEEVLPTKASGIANNDI